ncbi:carbamoyl transferase [Sphingobium lactosutens]|uniref:carbamoyltransferase family protein n=1 Tax=Sphingobium lactosutens TaxID=522773 RepID=UPI0015B8E135|nr:carbamoyltransferase N-terminal domain-containing protein [Sphingobium lactosutens]NWK94371.1 carbamoyl transferase [Sphingobium lactosutens]
MKILGISSFYHDAAAALLIDGLPVAAVQEERLSRRKNDAGFPVRAIEWCLGQAALEPQELDAVIFYERPALKFDRVLMTLLRGFPHSWRAFPKAMNNMLGEKLWVRGVIAAQLAVSARRVHFTDHHLSHAAAAFLTAPTESAAILTADGVGEWATLTLGRGRKKAGGATTIDLMREVRFPHSLGLFYSAFTAYLGFKVNEGEYKVMGLAAYGKPRWAREMRRILQRTDDGAFALDLAYFDYHRAVDAAYSKAFIDLFGPPRDHFEPIDLSTALGQHYADIAASAQLVLEEVIVDIATSLHRETGLADLCFGGGVALNGVANARILREAGFDRLFVPSAPGDAGCALGAALWADRILFDRPHRDCPDHPFWGPAVVSDDLARLAAEDGFPFARLSAAERIDQVVEAIASGEIVGWMEGATEFGPRALGHRSILADPGNAAMRAWLNRDIKFRESFRPFAPVVPADQAETYFELPPGGARLGRFMSGVFPVRPQWRGKLAAVTHVDGTARVQVLDRGMAPGLHALLIAYGQRRGMPILLNTSFNLAGDPIVTSVAEGYSTFRRAGMDMLVADDVMVRRQRARQEHVLEEVA